VSERFYPDGSALTSLAPGSRLSGYLLEEQIDRRRAGAIRSPRLRAAAPHTPVRTPRPPPPPRRGAGGDSNGSTYLWRAA